MLFLEFHTDRHDRMIATYKKNNWELTSHWQKDG